MSSYYHPHGNTLEFGAMKGWIPCIQRRTYCVKVQDYVDKWFLPWLECGNKHPGVIVATHLKMALVDLAKENTPSEDILKHPGYRHLRQCVLDDAKNQSNDDIAGVLWCSAKSKLEDEELRQAMIDELGRRNPELFSDKELGIIVWSLVVLRCHENSQSLYKTCVDEVIKRMNKDAFQDHCTLCQLCWCFSTVQQWPEGFPMLLWNHFNKNMQDLTEDQLINMVHWLGTSGLKERTRTRLSEVASSNLSELSTKVHRVTLLSLGQQHFFDRRYFQRLAESVLSQKFSVGTDPLLLCRMLYAFSSAGYYHHDLIEQLSATALEMIDKFSIIQLGRAVLSLSTLNHISKEFLELALKRIYALCAGGKGHVFMPSALKLMYGCLVCDFYPPELLSLVFDIFKDNKEVVSCLKWKDLKLLTQLDIALSLEHPDLGVPPIPSVYKLEMLNGRLAAYFAGQLNPSKYLYSPIGNRFRRAIQSVLNQPQRSLKYANLSTSGYLIGLEVLLDKENRPLIPASMNLEALRSSPDNCLRGVFSNFTKSELLEALTALPKSCTGQRRSVNFTSDWGWEWSGSVGRRIAVEFDSPSCFSVNDKHHLLGWSALKKRQLRALGWEVVEVPFSLWGDRSEVQLARYLWRKIFAPPHTCQ